MRDERLEVDAALRDEVDGELVVPRLITLGCVESGDQRGLEGCGMRDLRRSGTSP